MRVREEEFGPYFDSRKAAIICISCDGVRSDRNSKKIETAFTSDKERYLRQMWRSNACVEIYRKWPSLAHLRANLSKHSMLRRKLTYCYDWGQKLLLMIDEWKTGFSKKRLILFEKFLYLSFKKGAQRFGMIQINDLDLKKLKEIKTLTVCATLIILIQLGTLEQGTAVRWKRRMGKF